MVWNLEKSNLGSFVSYNVITQDDTLKFQEYKKFAPFLIKCLDKATNLNNWLDSSPKQAKFFLQPLHMMMLTNYNYCCFAKTVSFVNNENVNESD